VAGGFALCLALAPGVASAEDDPALPPPPEGVTDLLEEVPGVGQGAEDPEGEDPEGGGSEAEELPLETPEPPPFAIPPELVAAFQQFADQAGISEECVTGVTEALELIGNGIAGLPAELQEIATDLVAALQESAGAMDPAPLQDFLTGLIPAPDPEDPTAPPALPIGEDIAAGLQQLAETLASEACRPALPTPPTSAPPTQNPPQTPPAAYTPPQTPAAPAPQAPAAPTVYPGYAPTGAEAADPAPSPVAMGLALAVLAGGAAWTGRRWGASRH
jgi:hypothetical protein